MSRFEAEGWDQPRENVQTQRRIASTEVQARKSLEHLETRKETSLVGALLTNAVL